MTRSEQTRNKQTLLIMEWPRVSEVTHLGSPIVLSCESLESLLTSSVPVCVWGGGGINGRRDEAS